MRALHALCIVWGNFSDLIFLSKYQQINWVFRYFRLPATYANIYISDWKAENIQVEQESPHLRIESRKKHCRFVRFS